MALETAPKLSYTYSEIHGLHIEEDREFYILSSMNPRSEFSVVRIGPT